ncbi:lysylphosphatidylglycerol synthase domain-containing protein [Nocardioides xinjiangensis]|uniref:lysylphosphatidylglycerol synthase domain-containing protein n=1 Tax=Nocardioides xinjiangensis TaxID=2817376 RepID=UPI001B3017F7|nr:lysylphosphatidylglycerol synthase domain-containing protein [Nocardioides sp. SYSU D00514]
MSRGRLLTAARWLFVLLTLAGAWWGLRGRWADVADGLGQTGPSRLLAAAGLTAAGVATTGVVWRLLLRWIGSDVGPRDAAAVFFVGQLGKYVPGSVWSIAVQAQLGRRHGVPTRSSVTASSVFLLAHTATGLLLGGLLALAGALPGPSYGLAALAVAAGAVALAPPVLRRLADRLAGRGTRFGVRELGTTCVLMAVVWVGYGAALLLLVPGSSAPPPLGTAVAAFALAHAAGVLVVFAPAGVGAREGVLVALLAPLVGLPGAAAVALLSRVTHAVADFAVAGLAAWWARPRRAVLGAREPARAGGR